MSQICSICQLQGLPVGEIESKSKNIVEMLNTLCPSNVAQRMAEKICNSCYGGLIFASRFKQKCEQSVANLQTEMQITPISENIKQEANNNEHREGFESIRKRGRPIETRSASAPISHDEKPFKREVRLRKCQAKKNCQQHIEKPQSKIQSILKKTYEERLFKCKICLRRFQLRGLLQQHVERHKSKRHHTHCCKKCGRKFLVATHLEDHECTA